MKEEEKRGGRNGLPSNSNRRRGMGLPVEAKIVTAKNIAGRCELSF